MTIGERHTLGWGRPSGSQMPWLWCQHGIQAWRGRCHSRWSGHLPGVFPAVGKTACQQVPLHQVERPKDEGSRDHAWPSGKLAEGQGRSTDITQGLLHETQVQPKHLEHKVRGEQEQGELDANLCTEAQSIQPGRHPEGKLSVSRSGRGRPWGGESGTRMQSAPSISHPGQPFLTASTLARSDRICLNTEYMLSNGSCHEQCDLSPAPS